MCEYEYDESQITREGVDALLQFLTYFSDLHTCFGEDARISEGRIEPSALDTKPIDFCEACYEHGFVQDFDWSEWATSRQRLVVHGEGIEGLDLPEIGRLLTAHLRGERFCEGHLLEVMRSGQLARILQRLAALKEERWAV